MSKWLLTADWQADEKNLDTCRQVHGQEIMLGKLHKVKGIIDFGDLKQNYNPIDARVLEFMVDRWQNIRETFPVAIINMGNHDRIGQYDDKRNWFNVFQNMGIDAVAKPQVLVKENVVFACLPYMTDTKKLIKAATNLWKKAATYHKLRKVLLFHCDISGADYGLNRDSVSTVSSADLLCYKYSMCFGGHIHKRQWVSDNAMYVGNPFCFDWGERNQEKGFVLYDDETNKVEVLKSIIPNWYSYRYLQDKAIKKVAVGSRIQAAVQCSSKEDYYSVVTKMQDLVLHKYPGTKVFVKTEFVDEDDSIPVIEASATDIEKIESYVKAHAAADAPHEKISKYLQSVLRRVAVNTRSVEGIDFLSVKARNVLSYKKLDFDFRKRGLVLIQGVSKDWPNHSNGSGKTNFLSMLPIALESQTLKGQKTDDWLNEHVADKTGYVELETRDASKNKYLIHRSRRPSKLQFFINGRDETEDKPAHTQQTIRKRLGFTLETLKSSVYIDASLPKAFIEGTQKERTDLISKFQNLERFKLARDIVAKDVRKSEQAIEKLEEQSYELLNVVADARKEIKAAKQDAHASVSELKKQVVAAKEALKQKQRIKREYFENNQSRLRIAEEKAQALHAKQTPVVRETYTITDELAKQKRELEKMQRFKWKVCPTCQQRVSTKSRDEMYQTHKAHVEKLQQRFERLHRQEVKYKKRLTKVSDYVSEIKVRMNELSANEQRAERTLEAVYKAYKSHKEKQEKENEVTKLLKAKLKKAKRTLRYCKQAKRAEIDDKLMLMFSQKAFGRDGIPLYLNSLACPLLNKVAAEYSKMFTESEIQVVFKLVEGEFEPVVMNAHGSKTITGQSAGEMAWAGFITALSLRELAPKTNLLVLDEPGFGMDPESAKMFARKLPLLKDKFSTILVVTHNETIASLLETDSSLTIEKEARISRLLTK